MAYSIFIGFVIDSLKSLYSWTEYTKSKAKLLHLELHNSYSAGRTGSVVYSCKERVLGVRMFDVISWIGSLRQLRKISIDLITGRLLVDQHQIRGVIRYLASLFGALFWPYCWPIVKAGAKTLVTWNYFRKRWSWWFCPFISVSGERWTEVFFLNT